MGSVCLYIISDGVSFLFPLFRLPHMYRDLYKTSLCKPRPISFR